MMKRAAVVILLASAASGAPAQVPPVPPCWPASVGGTGSGAVVWPQAGVGTQIGWWCMVAGKWQPAGAFLPWMVEVKLRPLSTPWTFDDYLRDLWAQNVRDRPLSAAEQAVATAASVEIEKRRPADPPPAQWIVAPISIGVRPTFVRTPTGGVQRDGQTVTTAFNGAPRACECSGVSAIGGVLYCPVPSLGLAAQTAGRLAQCVTSPPKT